MKMNARLMIAPLLCILLAACNNNKSNYTREQVESLTDSVQSLNMQIKRLVILDNLLNSKDSLAEGEDGREVTARNANLCIGAFPTAMDKHGFKAEAGNVVLSLRRARKITRAEDFKGRNLLDWLVQTVETFDPKGLGENIRIKVVFGIYTPEFLANEHVGEALSRKKNDRVGVFLVPYSKITNKPLVTDNGKVFDLGGLDP
jgi:hypothetical protein